MNDVSLRVRTEVRDRLVAMASQRGTSIGQLLADLAGIAPSQADLAERSRACRELLANEYGHVVTDEDVARVSEWLDTHVGVPGGRSRVSK